MICPWDSLRAGNPMDLFSFPPLIVKVWIGGREADPRSVRMGNFTPERNCSNILLYNLDPINC